MIAFIGWLSRGFYRANSDRAERHPHGLELSTPQNFFSARSLLGEAATATRAVFRKTIPHAEWLRRNLDRASLIIVRPLGAVALVLEIALLGVAVSAAAHETITYAYDPRGRLVQVVHSGDTNNGLISTATFDRADNRMIYAVNCPTSAVITDASFEIPVQSAAGYTYDPVLSGTTFSGGAGISANNSPWGFAAAPDGNQVAFLQGVATISLNVSGLTPGASYNVNFWITQRTGQLNPVAVSVNGTALGTYTPASNAFAPVSTPAFVASSSTETLTFSSTGGAGGDVSSGLDFISIKRSGTCPTSSAAAVTDASFETPVQSPAGYTYNPVVSGATFSGGAGISANNSPWGFAAAPDGNQVAFLQAVATISLNVTGLTPGASYNVNFWMAQRTGQLNPVAVSINGTALGTFTPASNAFAPISTPAFVATSSTETLTFSSTGGPGGDVSSGLDSISITPGP